MGKKNKTKTIRVLVCRIGRAPAVEELQPDDRGGHLSAMQAVVGGLVECVNLGHLYGGVDLWCNEEGLINDLPVNCIIPAGVQPPHPDGVDFIIYADEGEDAPRLARPGEAGAWIIRGDFFLSHVDREGELADVDDATVKRWTAEYEARDRAAAMAQNAAGAK